MLNSVSESEASAKIFDLNEVGKVNFFVARTLISYRSNTSIERTKQLNNCAATTNNVAVEHDNRAAILNNSADYW